MQSTPTSHRVAATLRAAMEAQGVSQSALADATGIPRVTLIRRLNGQAPFNVEELASVAAHLNLPLGELLDGAA